MYIIYFVSSSKGCIQVNDIDWLTFAEDEHGIDPSDSVMIIPGTVDPRDD